MDQGSFRPVNAPSVTYAVREFLKRVTPADYVGMISFPLQVCGSTPRGTGRSSRTRSRSLPGLSQLKPDGAIQFSLADAIDVAARDRDALARNIQRNCPANDLTCGRSVENEMQRTGIAVGTAGIAQPHGLREVVGHSEGA